MPCGALKLADSRQEEAVRLFTEEELREFVEKGRMCAAPEIKDANPLVSSAEARRDRLKNIPRLNKKLRGSSE